MVQARITNTWNDEVTWQHKKINRQNKECRKCTKSWSSRRVLVQCHLVDN